MTRLRRGFAGAASLSTDVSIPRARPPLRSATLKQLVRVLATHERDLRDCVFETVCVPRCLAQCADDLPRNPAGGLGKFALTVPMGTTAIAGDAFTECGGIAQVTLPPTVTAIETWCVNCDSEEEAEEAEEAEEEEIGAFSGCSSLREITLPPNLT